MQRGKKLKMTKLCYINRESPHFLAFQSVVFTGSLLVTKKRQFVGDKNENEYCRCSKWPSLAATAMYAVKRWVRFATALLTCSCGSSFQMVYKATFNSSAVLGFSWSLWYFFSMAPHWIDVENLRATQSSQWTSSHHSVSSASRSNTEKWGLSWYKQHDFVIFLHILTKLGDQVCLWYV